MTRVGVAELKASLSRYLREVRRGGSVTVLDRGTPIARLVPVQAPGKIRIIPPADPGPGFFRVSAPSEPPPEMDVVALLLEDRARG